jgi:hypothetical protein
MLNLAGSSYDFGNVSFAVLQECEHQRRALLPNEAEARLKEIARVKLAEIHESYVELGGAEPYWQSLEKEVLETTMPQYIPAAIEQTRLERSNYDLWRQGDPAARILLGLIGLAIGVLIVAIPEIPITEKAVTLFLAALGFLYPEIKQTYFDFRHSRTLNRLIVQADTYQKDQRLHYVSEARLQEELAAVGAMGAIPAARASMPGLQREEKPAEAGSEVQPRAKSRL